MLVIDPEQPQRVYAAGDTGVFRSTDAGQSWQSAVDGLPEGAVGALTLDPQQPERLYAAMSTGAIYLSEDGASTWRALSAANSGH